MLSSDPFQFLPAHGEMAQRVRAHHWAQTPLGVPADWPENLRTALSLCLSSRFPMLLWWGPDFRIIYNDAYIPFLGPEKHPAALGQAGAECWSEIWDSIGPMLQSVFDSGTATWSYDEQYFFNRHMPHEEVYVTFTYGPILAGDGKTVQGIFCPCNETTPQVVAARRLDTLRKLSGQRALDSGALSAAEHFCEVLAGSQEDVAFCAIYDLTAGQANLLACTGLSAQQAEPQQWPWAREGPHGAARLLNLAASGLEVQGGAWQETIQSARLQPLHWSGDGSVSGLILLGLSTRRPADAGYLDFLDLVATAAASAIAAAVAYEQERLRAEALAELDRAKTAFFANVSHEFRTPLTLMLGPLEQALDSGNKCLEAGALQMVHRNAVRLQHLVNRLLDYSRLEAGRMTPRFELTKLGRATEQHASVFRSAIEAAGLAYYVDCEPVEAWVDRDLYEKMVLNLLSNAFKYTRSGEISVQLRAVGEQAELSVRDTGIGIAPEVGERVFERFYRAQGVASRTHEGTGIGLSLVREMARLHDGDIRLRSTPGQGSTFVLTLPKRKAHLPSPEQPLAEQPALEPRATAEPYALEAEQWLRPVEIHQASAAAPRARILCVDDNADMRDYVASVLGERYEIQLAADGFSALRAIAECMPDLVLSDVMMPGMDGLSLVQSLRASAMTSALPIILLSARAGQEAREEGLEAGADDYLIKPFAGRDLLARVTAQLRLAHLRQQTVDQLRANERRLHAIIEQLPVGVGVSDIDGQWVLSNAIMDRYAPQSIPSVDPAVSSQWFGWDENQNPVAPENWPGQRALRGESVTPGTEMQHIAADGVESWMRVSAAPLLGADGQLLGTCSVVQDISRLKNAEHELRLAHRRKDEFLATLAHELRNPLAPMHNGVHLLRRGVNQEESQRIYDMLQRQVTHMHRLVDDLLEIARISNGKILLRKEDVVLADVIRNALDITQAAIEAGGHSLAVEQPSGVLMLHADPVRLAQVVANLLSNAAKYTPAGGRIELSVRRDGGHVRIAVKDNGIGIAEDKLGRVFDLFAQLDDSGRQGGLGIGLTLVRKLVELHEGEVRASSQGPGQGAEFVVRLPYIPVDARTRPTERPLVQTSRLGRVLVVDDNRDAADSTALVLQALGAQVHVVANGPAALAQLEQFDAQVIMLDIGMPGMDGYEVARRVRQRGHAATLIAMTGWGLDSDIKRSSAAGFDHHLVKPMDFDALEALLLNLQQSRSGHAPT